ncbi:hypothetical protein CPB83DRAFT_416293 [Crepidotus variabilis]|uniref:PARP catalytic domain-containing protein n=1 Tax=Crepidotus variabilis TaxID=179855 RepID=A0A9P6EQ26_9AGAR|nr:hypothetical protein CPB83DRAFT_416293 [Crepidotus variabilis]
MSSSSNQNCEFCHNKPKFPSSDYCSRTCRNNALCKECRRFPKFAGFDYCSRTCGVAAKGSTSPSVSKRASSFFNFGPKPAKASNPATQTRSVPPVYNSAVVKSVVPPPAPTVVRQSSQLLQLSSSDRRFQSVADQFKTSWRHPTPCPKVKYVYKIIFNNSMLAKYNAYKASVESRGNFAAAGRQEGNENRRWHGTHRECNLGDRGQTKLCSSKTCSLCSILRNSYDLNFWGKKTGFGSNNSKFKAMLLNLVVVGNGCKLTTDDTTLTAPPSGYDSVLAEVGSALNYDELVVYTNDAIRPSYLVMYEA